ncbi:MAG: ComEA family DNA-binding protein [bacterium]
MKKKQQFTAFQKFTSGLRLTVSSTLTTESLIKKGLTCCAAAIFLFSTAILAFGQETMMEKLLEEQSENSEQSDLVEIILNLKENPIELNTATAHDLENIPGLSSRMIREILNYRQQNGPFQSKLDLLLVPDIDFEIFEFIRDLVYLDKEKAAVLPKRRIRWRARLSDRIDRPIGFTNGKYQSTPQKIYHKLQCQLHQKVEGGLVLEKDSGESRLDDLRLFYLSLRVHEHLALLVGHFQLEFGQGLVLWGPYGFSKSSDSIFPIRKRARGLIKYTSVDENAGFRGGGLKFSAGAFQITAFASTNKLDATPISQDTVSGIFTSGFHRNPAEKLKKDVLAESVFGGHVQYKYSKGVSIGLSFYRSRFDKLLSAPDTLRNHFKFRGRQNSVIGLNWLWQSRRWNLFGEVALSQSGGRAFLAGAQTDLGKLQLAWLFRDYKKEFQNLHGFGFGESNGATQNERGYYTGLRYQLTSATVVNAFFDIFKNPWSTYFNRMPTDGREFLGQIEQKIGGKVKLLFRIRDKQEQKNEKYFDEFERDKFRTVNSRKTQLRLQMDYRISNRVRLRSRIEFAHYKKYRWHFEVRDSSNHGYLMYQEMKINPTKKLQVIARLTFFDIDSFESRIYQYEQDLPGVMTNIGFSGRGNKWYLIIKYQAVNFMQFHFKYSETCRDDQHVIGSGWDRLTGNLDRRFGFQMDLKL